MAKILHVVNYFDPAGDVVRCVRELRLYSRHEHDLLVAQIHPLQHIYRYEIAEHGLWNTEIDNVMAMLEWADAILFHFVGYERGVDNHRKPAAFRNLNIYWDKSLDRFWSAPEYNAGPLERYRLVSSSHVGAMDFLPKEKFRWLPDLLPIDGLYSPDYSERPERVSFIKHHAELSAADFGRAAKLDLHDTPHEEVLRLRRSLATLVIDNVCDGHWGLAGQEAVLMGLPTFVFNHRATTLALESLGPSPFEELPPNVADIAGIVKDARGFDREKIRRNAVECFASVKLIRRWWDPFFDELLA